MRSILNVVGEGTERFNNPQPLVHFLKTLPTVSSAGNSSIRFEKKLQTKYVEKTRHYRAGLAYAGQWTRLALFRKFMLHSVYLVVVCLRRNYRIQEISRLHYGTEWARAGSAQPRSSVYSCNADAKGDARSERIKWDNWAGKLEILYINEKH